MTLRKFITAILALIAVITAMGQGVSVPEVPELPSDKTVLPSPQAAAMFKYEDFPVSYASGTANVHVPLINWQVGTFSWSIDADYHTGGIRAAQHAGPLGVGWVLGGLPTITRTVEGWPDGMRSFSEKLSSSNLRKFYTDTMDIARDRYRVDLPGRSATFYIENGTTIKLFSDDAFEIEREMVDSMEWDFLVTTPDGAIYRFAEREHCSFESKQQAFDNTSRVTRMYDYVSTWHLSEVITPDRCDSIRFTYIKLPQRSENRSTVGKTVRFTNGKRNGSSGEERPGVAQITRYKDERVVSRISCRTASVSFAWEENTDGSYSLNPRRRLTEIVLKNHTGREVRKVMFQKTKLGQDKRNYLRRINFYDSGELADSRQFDYFMSNPTNTITDMWGFYTGRNGSDGPILNFDGTWNTARFYSFNGARGGSLHKVTDHMGSVTEFEYEPNRYDFIKALEDNSAASRTMAKAPQRASIWPPYTELDPQPLKPIVIPDSLMPGGGSGGGTEPVPDSIWWKVPVAIGVRIKSIRVTDAVTYKTKVRSFDYDLAKPTINIWEIEPSAFCTLTAYKSTGSSSGGGDWVTQLSNDYGSGITGGSDTAPANTENRSLSLLDKSRLPGLPFENATIYYGWVRESIYDDSLPTDTLASTIYAYDTDGCVNKFIHGGIGNPDLPLHDFEEHPDAKNYALISYPNYVTGFFEERIGAEPLLKCKQVLARRNGSWVVSEQSGYQYRQENSRYATGWFVESTEIGEAKRWNQGIKYHQNQLSHFSYLQIFILHQKNTCDSVVTTRYYDKGLQRTVNFRLYDNDCTLLQLAGTLEKPQGAYDFYERKLQSLFGDSIKRAVGRTLPIGIKATCGDVTVEKYFLHADNMRLCKGFENRTTMYGNMPVAEMWICGTDTIDTRTYYRMVALSGGVKAPKTDRVTFGRHGRKPSSVLRFPSYSPYGHPQEVAANGSPGMVYLWGEGGMGDCMRSSMNSNSNYHTAYEHIPLVGCTSITAPSGLKTLYEYTGGRLTKIKDGSGNPIQSYNYTFINGQDYPELINSLETTVYTSAAGASSNTVRDYYDSFGRKLRSVALGAGASGENIVGDATAYDALDRATVQFRPFPVGDPLESAINLCSRFYDDVAPCDSVSYSMEADKTVWSYAAGADLRSHPAKTRVTANRNGTPLYTCARITLKGSQLFHSGNWPDGLLEVTESVDADSHRQLVFTDFMGRKVLERREHVPGNYLDTYYVTDNLGRVTAVLTPECSAIVTKRPFYSNDIDNGTTLTDGAYRYCYNDSMQLVWKRMPGCAPIRYVYDGTGALIFSQDGEQRKRGEVAFSLPTDCGEPAITGICSAENLPDISTKFCHAEWTGKANTPDSCGYQPNITLQNARILKANYYNTYTYLNLGHFKTLRSKASVLPSGKKGGLCTGTLIAMLTGTAGSKTNSYIASTVMYDSYDRPYFTSTMYGSGTLDETTTGYTFDGRPLTVDHLVTRYANATSATTHWEDYRTTYDHAGRVTAQTVSVDGGKAISLAKSTYTPIGQLRSVTPGTNNPAMIYRYDTRGAIDRIYAGGFSQELYYTKGAATPCYNGNVARSVWQVPYMTALTYDYTYDGADRLIRAKMSDDGSGTGRDYSTEYTYNRDSAPLTIRRKGATWHQQFGMVDDLTFKYSHGRVTRVDDAADEVLYETSMDFNDGAQADDEMAYDLNGRLIKDLNRNITQIEYNDASLPSAIYINGTKRYGMTYDADGNLLSRTEFGEIINLPMPGISRAPSFGGSSFRPEFRLVVSDYNYYGSQIWDGNTLDRIEATAGYIKNDTLSAYYRDYQGNICMVMREGECVQSTSYYPYGMPFGETHRPDEQRHKYSGKELLTHAGLNCYDFGPRSMNPALALFDNPDLLQEKYYGFHAYLYCAANPIRNIDPSGMKIVGGLKEWETLKGDISKLRESLVNELSNPDTAAKLSESAYDDMAQRAQRLNNTLKTMNQMETSAQAYNFNKVSDNIGSVLLNNTTIDVNYVNDANAVHEITHAGQFETGDIAFLFGTGNTIFQDLGDEVDAYKAQYAYSPESIMGQSSSIQGINDINSNWVQSLYYISNRIIYFPYWSWYSNISSQKLNINSTVGDLRTSFPYLTIDSKFKDTDIVVKVENLIYHKTMAE